MPRSLSPKPMYEFHLAESKVKYAALRWIAVFSCEELITSDDFHMGFLKRICRNERTDTMSGSELTSVSIERSHKNTPNALASGQHILPLPQAATEADSRRS